ncbi:MAG TPA: DHA2 family efflux MFS transporter permease subunit [Rhizomicrobium sp.]|nr:DHA2 family efflux MFS transporter permease subunit [Rhizomicrobium sp.]
MMQMSQPTPAPRPHFRTIALIVGAAMFMEQLDGTVLATALPSMARELGVIAPSLSVALTSYLISLAIFIPVSGRIADRFGARTVFRNAIIVFTLGSILCGQAPNVPFLVAARFFQGIGGALMLPVGRLVLMRSVEKRDLIQATSWVLIPAVVGPILGPPLGGFIVTYLDWRWIFYINVPIGIVGVMLVNRYIADTRADGPQEFDFPGVLLTALSLGLLLFGFELTSHEGALTTALILLVVGSLAGVAYVFHARRATDPILDITLMKIPTYGTSVIAGAITRITQGAHPFLLPLMMQLGFGFTAAQSGMMTLATAIGSIAAKPVAPPILRRFGFRDTLMVNGFFASAGYAICGLFRPGWPLSLMFAIMVLSGFFMSIQFTGYNTIAYDEISSERMGTATSFYTTFQQLMLSVGICAGAAALEGAMVLRGHAHPALGDFTVAFWAVAAISLTATIWNRRFSHEAGTEISGHTPRTLQGPAGAPEELTFGELANDQFHRPLRHLRDR